MKRIAVFTIALLVLPAALESNPTAGTKEAKAELPVSVGTSSQAGSPAQLQELRQNTRELQFSIDWLKWGLGIGLGVMLAGFAVLVALITYLHSDTQQNIAELKTDTQRDIQKLGASIQELKTDTQRDIQKLGASIQELKTDTQRDIQKLGASIQELKTDTQQNIAELKASARQDKEELKQDMQKLESGIQEIRSFLFQLVQNKSHLPLSAGQAGQSQS